MENNIFEQILKQSYSLSILKHRIRILKSYLSGYFFNGPKEQFKTEDQNFLSSLPKDFYSSFNKNNFNEIFSQFDQNISKLPALTIYLAFEPSDEAIERIGTKVRQLFSPNLILDVKYDPRLIAGCALVWGGVYKDYSLKLKIEESKDKILESFKKFLR